MRGHVRISNYRPLRHTGWATRRALCAPLSQYPVRLGMKAVVHKIRHRKKMTQYGRTQYGSERSKVSKLKYDERSSFSSRGSRRYMFLPVARNCHGDFSQQRTTLSQMKQTNKHDFLVADKRRGRSTRERLPTDRHTHAHGK